MASRFVFNASAIGIAGQITRPVTQPVPSLASALPSGGGYATNKQAPDQLLEIYSHAGATTEATGITNDAGDHETTVTATVQGLNIGNVVQMDSCMAYLSSVHPGDGMQLPRFNTQGSLFKNLQIAGHVIELVPNPDLPELATLNDWRNYYKGNKEFRERFLKEAFVEGFVDQRKSLHEKQEKYFPYRNRKLKNTNELPVSSGTQYTVVPLFIVNNPSDPGFHVSSNVITVDNFGTIVLGELLISAYEWRLTMLHAELGSPAAGKMSACAVVGNGGGVDP